MAHPKSRAELLAQTAKERDALGLYLSTLSREQLEWPGAYGWSAKDHVSHLAEWERMLLYWYDAGMRGESPAVPAEGYTWATMDALNRRIYELRRNDPVGHVMADWQESSRRLLVLAESIPEDMLFAPGRFAWTGRGTLASFFWECGDNHYRWAMVEIKRGLKVRR
jgi:hypothetical protein